MGTFSPVRARPMPQMASPSEVMGQAASLQGMLQSNKMGKMQLDEATAAKKDQELLQQIWMEKGGDDDATLAEAPRRGVRMQTVRALQAQRLKARKELFDMEDSERKAKQENAKFISSAIFPLTQIPEGPEGDAALVQQSGRVFQELVRSGVIPPKNAQEQAQSLQQPPAQIRQRVNTLAMMGVQADKQFEAVNAEKKAIADAQRKREERTEDEKNFQYEYQNFLEAAGLKPNAKIEREQREIYRKQQKERTAVPGVDVPLPADVEEQRKRMNAARAQVNGLSPQQLTKVNSLASQFDSNPIVQRFNLQVNHAASVKAIVEGKWTGPGDMGVIYEFMKALDPTSVVRESEYAAASKTGNIFLGWAARFNGAFRPEGGFMSEQVKKDFGNVLEKKLAVSNQQVKQMHGDFARRIDKITGQGDGKEYLSDYSTLYGQQGGGTVKMRAPNGQINDVPADQVEHFKSKGAVVVNQ